MSTTKQLKSRATRIAKEFMAEDRVLVYHYRANGHPLVKDGLAVIPRHELEDILRTHPTLQTTKKAIPPRARSVDIYQRDLLPPVPTTDGSGATEGSGAAEPKLNGTEASNVAGVTLPVVVWLEGLVRGKGKGFGELIVVSERMGVPAVPAGSRG